jgi:hypothetical protein
MNGNAIQLVSKAVQDLLTATFAQQGIHGGVYIGPLDDAEAAGQAAVLFLYRISVNADLRNAQHIVAGDDDTSGPRVHEGALPLDLHFLFTGRNLPTDGERDVGLMVLGYAMQALNGSPNLVGLAVQGETVRLTLDPVSSEEMSRIWALFPTVNYRTSVVYRASPVWIDPSELPAIAPPVHADRTRAGSLQP